MKLFTALLTGLTLLLAACSPTPTPGGDTGSSGQPESVTKGEPMTITAFEFSHRGSMANDCYWYRIEETDEGVHLRSEALYSGGEVLDFTVEDDPILTQLGELAGAHRTDRWNGFDKTSSAVLDGSSFSLDITLAGGDIISARGSNRFPDGYSAFYSELTDLITQTFARHGKTAPMAL